MKTSPLLVGLGLVGLALAGAACSSDDSGTSGTGGTTGSGGAGSGGEAQEAATTASSGQTSGPGSGGGGGGGGGSGGETVTLVLDSFEVAPGEEVYKCQNFANPFGEDAQVTQFESHMTGGSHHLLLFYGGSGQDEPLEDCSGLEFAATPYSTQLPDDSVAFPPGVAAEIPASTGLRLQSHYLNVTGETITAQVEVTLHRAEPGTITDLAGVMFIVQPNIQVDPNSTEVVSYDCNVPADMFVMKASSHMHKHGTLFTSTVDGETFYDTDTWDEPVAALFDPPRALAGGAPLRFECTFQNTSNQTLTFGESAESNEMCILVASYYPAVAGQPTIGCQ